MSFEKGEYGEVLNRIQKKFSCPVFPNCRSMFDSEKEALQHFLDEHDYSELERTDS